MARPATHSCSACGQKMAAAKLKDGKCKPGHGCAPAASADAKPAAAAPAKPKQRITRGGKPERTHCRICDCDDAHECDLGAGRTCSWVEGEGASLCSLCAELIDNAEELLERVPEPTPQEVAASLAESCEAPCVAEQAGEKRIAACVTAAIARLKAKGEAPAEPDDGELRAEVLEFLRANPDGWITGGAIAGNVGRSLPFARVHAAILAEVAAGNVEQNETDRGAFRARLCGNRVLVCQQPMICVKVPGHPGPHNDCDGRAWDSEAAIVTLPIEPRPAPNSETILAEPCDPENGGCDAAIGVPCAFTPQEPASWAHAARFDRFADRERRDALRRRGIEDRISAQCDYHAKLPGDPPVPTREGLVRGLVIPGECSAPELRERIEALLERGAIREQGGAGGNAYLRRADGGAPIAMGRVGLMVATKASEAVRLQDLDGQADRVDCAAEEPAPLPPGADDVPPGTYAGSCGGCAEENHTGGNWGAPHDCGRPDLKVIVTYPDAPPPSPRRFVEPDTEPGTPEAKRAAREDDEEPRFPEMLAAAIEDIGDTLAALKKTWNRSDLGDVTKLRAELEAEQRAHMATRGREATARAELENERRAHADTRVTEKDLREEVQRQVQRVADISAQKAETIVERDAAQAKLVATRDAFTTAGAKAEQIATDLRGKLDQAWLDQRAAETARDHAAERLNGLRLGLSELCEFLGAERPADETKDADLLQALRVALGQAVSVALAEYQATHSSVMGRSIEEPAPVINPPAPAALAFTDVNELF